MLLQGWPAQTDDAGDKTSGTIWNKAFEDAVKASVEDNVHSTANPAVRTRTIIDEVVEARGNKSTVNQRINGVIDADGNLISPGGAATVAQIKAALGAANLVGNDDFQLWPDGDAAAPLYWVLTGAGGTIARTGTGLVDTSRKVGDFAAKVTRAGTDVVLSQLLLPSTGAFGRADFLKGQTVGAGCWVKCGTGSVARVSVTDGVTTTASSYHTGGGAWEWLSLTHTLDTSASLLKLQLETNTSNVAASFSGAVMVLATVAPSGYIACPTGYGYFQFEVTGAISNAVDVRRTAFHRGGIIKDIQGYLKTAGTTINIDLLSNTNATPTYASMLAATLAFGAAKWVNGQPGTGTYARRCLRGVFGAAPGASSLVSLDISNVTGAPADLSVMVRVLQYLRPLEGFLGYSD